MTTEERESEDGFALMQYLKSKYFSAEVHRDGKKKVIVTFFKNPHLYLYFIHTKLLNITTIYLNEDQKLRIKTTDLHVSIDKLKSMLEANEKELLK